LVESPVKKGAWRTTHPAAAQSAGAPVYQVYTVYTALRGVPGVHLVHMGVRYGARSRGRHHGDSSADPEPGRLAHRGAAGGNEARPRDLPARAVDFGNEERPELGSAAARRLPAVARSEEESLSQARRSGVLSGR